MAVNKGTETPANTAIGDALQRAGVKQGQQTQQPQGAQNMSQNQNQNYGQPGQQQSGQRQGIVQAMSRQRRAFGRSSVGEVVKRLNTAAKEIFDSEVEDNVSYKLIPFDGHKNRTPLSALLLTLSDTVAGNTHVAVHVLLIEASGGKLMPTYVNINNQSVEVMTVASDVYNQTMWDRVAETLYETFGESITLHDAGATVIPTELRVEDTERLRTVLYKASEAVNSVMDNHVGTDVPPFALTSVDNRDAVVARLDYAPGEVTTAAGLPVRSDVCVTLQGQVAGTQNQPEMVQDITRIDAYVDLVYDPSASQQMMGGFGQMQPATQYYHPRCIITQADTGVDVISMELLLLALSSAGLLSRNMAWGGVFRQRFDVKKGELDMRDIGAVGYDINLTGDPQAKQFERINTNAANFTTNQLYQLLQTVMYPGLIYSMDVEEASDMSWINLTFIAAANGNADARDAIIQAADILTGGNFSQMYNGAPICVDDVNRIHLGYYTDEKGRLRDLRQLDYLAMLNLTGDKDINYVVEFADTYDRVDIPLEIRLEKRARIIQNVLGESVHFKGFARRITFTADFMTTLQAACAATGLQIRPSNTIQDFTGVGQRGNSAIGAYAVSGQQGGLFNYTQPGFGRNYQGMGVNMGQWGRR